MPGKRVQFDDETLASRTGKGFQDLSDELRRPSHHFGDFDSEFVPKFQVPPNLAPKVRSYTALSEGGVAAGGSFNRKIEFAP
jgi:hypothetical protein